MNSREKSSYQLNANVIATLPREVLIYLLQFISLRDVLNVGQASRFFNRLMRFDDVWVQRVTKALEELARHDLFPAKNQHETNHDFFIRLYQSFPLAYLVVPTGFNLFGKIKDHFISDNYLDFINENLKKESLLINPNIVSIADEVVKNSWGQTDAGVTLLVGLNSSKEQIVQWLVKKEYQKIYEHMILIGPDNKTKMFANKVHNLDINPIRISFRENEFVRFEEAQRKYTI